MNTLIILLYIVDNFGEKTFVGFLTGVAAFMLMGVLSWISRKKKVKEERKEHEEAKAQSFVNSQDDTYYHLLIKELRDICNPNNFMQPYVYEKVSAANELFSMLQNESLGDEEILEIRRRAESELGVLLPTKTLFSLLKDACNPSKYMSPYNKEKVAKANDLYNDLLRNENNLSALERIGNIARQEGFLTSHSSFNSNPPEEPYSWIKDNRV